MWWGPVRGWARTDEDVDLKRKLSPVRVDVDEEELVEAYYALSDFILCSLSGDTDDHREAEAWAREHLAKLDDVHRGRRPKPRAKPATERASDANAAAQAGRKLG